MSIQKSFPAKLAASAALCCALLVAPVSAATADTQDWPGSQTVTALDAQDENRTTQWSGLDYSDGTLWAVENGYGTLYKLTESDGSWNEDQTWILHYADGSGQVDAEGVTVTDDGYVYVSSERDTSSSAASEVSRPSILKYDTSSGSSELNAVTEWNLAEDFPDIDANAGLEGITWIPDSYLTSAGLVDQNTGEAYDPSDYTDHGNGLFAVSVEGTSGVYLYALQDDGTAVQIAAISTDFDTVAELEFNADAGGLWVISDDSDKGKTATYTINSNGEFEQTALYKRPSDTDNYANEGFTIADSSTATDGSVTTFYADDANTNGHSLREGTLNTAELVDTTATASATSSGSTASAESASAASVSAASTNTAAASAGSSASSADSNSLFIGGLMALAVLAVGVMAVLARRRP